MGHGTNRNGKGYSGLEDAGGHGWHCGRSPLACVAQVTCARRRVHITLSLMVVDRGGYNHVSGILSLAVGNPPLWVL